MNNDDKHLSTDQFVEQVLVDVMGLQQLHSKIQAEGGFIEVDTWIRDNPVPLGQAEYFGFLKAWYLRQSGKLDQSLGEAQTLSRVPTVRLALCQVLSSLSDDARKVATAISPVLLTLSATHALPISLSSIATAQLALMISRAGVKVFCQEYLPTEQDKE